MDRWCCARKIALFFTQSVAEGQGEVWGLYFKRYISPTSRFSDARWWDTFFKWPDKGCCRFSNQKSPWTIDTSWQTQLCKVGAPARNQQLRRPGTGPPLIQAKRVDCQGRPWRGVERCTALYRHICGLLATSSAPFVTDAVLQPEPDFHNGL